MKTTTSAALAALLMTGATNATTVYTGGTVGSETDFLEVDNWNNGVANGTNGAGRINADAVLAANHSAGISNIIVGHGSDATLTINSGVTLTTTGSAKVDVGRGSNVGTLIVNGTLASNANINIINGSMTVANKLAIKGIATVENSGSLSVANNIDLVANTSSQLYFKSQATFSGTPSIVTARNGTTIAFDIDGTDFTTLAGDSMQLRLGATPTLAVNFLAAPTIGQSFDLFTGVENFTNYLGNGTGNTFNTENITGLDAGQDYNLVYDTTVADDGFLRLEIITAVPEPSSTALLGLGGLALILRRRK